MVTIGETYVERVEKALVETTILTELQKEDGLAITDLVARVKGIGGFDEKVDDGFVRACAKRLDRDGHVREREGRYHITPDGLEDVTKVNVALCNVAESEGGRAGASSRLSTSGPEGF